VKLSIQQSVWRTKAGQTKNEYRARPILVIEPLKSILAALRRADGFPQSGPILRGPSGKPLHVDNLARRVIKPALKKAGIEWVEYRALRRGAGTLVTAMAKDDGHAAKGLLRHSNLATTTAHYIGDVPKETENAMRLVEQLFDNCSTDVPQQ
jgi:integrase